MFAEKYFRIYWAILSEETVLYFWLTYFLKNEIEIPVLHTHVSTYSSVKLLGILKTSI